MIEQLFGSKTRYKLLKLFLTNPNRSFYVREITRKVEEQINSVRRELSNLLSLGIICSDTTDNKLYYEVNQQHEHYAALAALFGATVSVGIEKNTKKKDEKLQQQAITEEFIEAPKVSEENQEIARVGNVELAFLTGQFTRDSSAGVDLFVVGDVNHTALDKFVAELEKSEGKEIRYSAFTHSEFNYRKQVNDRFISNVMLAKKQILIDKIGIITHEL